MWWESGEGIQVVCVMSGGSVVGAWWGCANCM